MNETLGHCPDYYVKYFESRRHAEGNTSAWILTFFVVNVLSSIFATIANALVIAAIFGSYSRRNPSLLMLTNMVFTDLAVGAFGQPLFAALMFAVSKNYFDTFCRMLYPTRFFTGTLCPASFLTISLISVDRYLAIRLKLRYRSIVTNTRVIISLVVVWGISLVGGITFNTLHYGELVNIFSVGVFICLTIILFSYIQSFRALKSHCLKVQAQENTQERQSLQRIINVKKYKTMLKTMALIVALMLLFYTPIAVSMLVFKLQGIHSKSLALFYIASTLALVNSSINPAIYIWKIEEIRQACFQLTRKLFCTENNVIIIRQTEGNSTAVSDHKETEG